jgi:hypothetical protein
MIASATAGNAASINLGVIGRKGEPNPAVGESLRHHTNRDQFGEIVSRPRDRQLLENWKIALRPQPASRRRKRSGRSRVPAALSR